ncbi:uncharacterized protein LOC144440209 [Glandiceps talaboti]
MGLKLPIVFFASVLAVGFVTASAYDTKAVNADLLVGLRYMTAEVQTVFATQSTLYKASTCREHIGDAVNISIILNNNPLWDPNNGVVYFYVVDAESKKETDALCHNHVSGKPAVPYCTVSNWKSTSDLFVYAIAGRVQAISFTMNVIFTPKTAGQRTEGVGQLKPRDPNVKFPPKQSGLVYLKQIAMLSYDQPLQYHNGILLNVSFCPDAGTTSSYQIVSTVFGTDITSSFTQYICNDPDCSVESSHVVGFNGNQLPSNTVHIETHHREYSTIYVYVYGWGGEYNPATKEINGHFRYSASVSPVFPGY